MKLIPILVTIIGIVLILPLVGVTALGAAADWIVALAVLIIGIGKLIGKL